MRVHDPLYGVFDIENRFVPLVSCAEFQRLKDIRLINIHSQTFPALSDIRRYTHCLGVFYLGLYVTQTLKSLFTDQQSRNEFLCACLLHDIGTPPYAHLLEYRLRDATGWDHEKAVWDVLLGSFSGSGIHHQLYFNAPLQAFSVLEKMSVDLERVYAIIRGLRPSGALLCGELDVDNMDNVNRMGWGLGFRKISRNILSILRATTFKNDKFQYSEDISSAVREWARNREEVYRNLTLDPATVASQCMLTECFEIALESQFLTEEDWFLTDDQVVRKLLTFTPTKQLIQRLMNFDLYRHVVTIRIRGVETYETFIARKTDIEERLSCSLGTPISTYGFADRGTFSKNVTTKVFAEGGIKEYAISTKSSSVIVSVFSKRRSKVSAKQTQRAKEDLLTQLGLGIETVLLVPSDSGNVT